MNKQDEDDDDPVSLCLIQQFINQPNVSIGFSHLSISRKHHQYHFRIDEKESARYEQPYIYAFKNKSVFNKYVYRV